MISNLVRSIVTPRTIKNVAIASAILYGIGRVAEYKEVKNLPYIEMTPKDVPTDIYEGLNSFSQEYPDISNDPRYTKFGEDTLSVNLRKLNGKYWTDLLFFVLKTNTEEKTPKKIIGYTHKTSYVSNGKVSYPVKREVPIYKYLYENARTVFKTDKFFTKPGKYFGQRIYLPVEYYGIPNSKEKDSTADKLEQ